jgi:Zn finger protein HypA/HybF involved in hydrogenase expression
MKINIDKNLVEFTPETADEKSYLVALWRLLVDCARFNKKLVPVGEYLPDENEFARFAIEGLEDGKRDDYAEVYVEKECTCFCQTCNKFVNLKKGDRIPPCCGKLMEVID